jgi:hypothetical protein
MKRAVTVISSRPAGSAAAGDCACAFAAAVAIAMVIALVTALVIALLMASDSGLRLIKVD